MNLDCSNLKYWIIILVNKNEGRMSAVLVRKVRNRQLFESAADYKSIVVNLILIIVPVSSPKLNEN